MAWLTSWMMGQLRTKSWAEIANDWNLLSRHWIASLRYVPCLHSFLFSYTGPAGGRPAAFHSQNATLEIGKRPWCGVCPEGFRGLHVGDSGYYSFAYNQEISFNPFFQQWIYLDLGSIHEGWPRRRLQGPTQCNLASFFGASVGVGRPAWWGSGIKGLTAAFLPGPTFPITEEYE